MRGIAILPIVSSLWAQACLAAPATPAPAIASIDFFGLRTISEADVRRRLPFKEGDPLPDKQGRADDAAIARALGVAKVTLAFVCCTADERFMAFVGVAEKPLREERGPREFNGTTRLPEEAMQAYSEFENVLMDAVKAQATEDDSQGHALSAYAPMRTVQEKFLAQARDHAALLADVLATAADARHRAIAAMILGYSPDKRAVAAELARAAFDSDQTVRNNATRGLAVIAEYAQSHPELNIHIDAEPFIGLLNSVVWTDLNKGAWVVSALTAGRDPELLKQVRERARPALIDICRWKSPGHSTPGCLILRRLEGLPDFSGADDRAEVLRKVDGGSSGKSRP